MISDSIIDCNFVLIKSIQIIEEKTLIYLSNGTINISTNSFFY
jgi:hypothetical protein